MRSGDEQVKVKGGKDIAYKYKKNNGVLTVTVEADYAVLAGSLSDSYALTHDGKTATLNVG